MSKTTPLQDQLRNLPAVNDVLLQPEVAEWTIRHGANAVRFCVRQTLEHLRDSIKTGTATATDMDAIRPRLKQALTRLVMPQGRKVLNGTGILLHTGIGRAPLCEEAIAAYSVMNGYSILQTDLETGKRNLREEKIEGMLRELTGCEAATIVNNNAAATMLVLNTLAKEKEVIISRGQLIEIGGAYRMTDVMAMSDAVLREVGCTNRTHLRDYEEALTEETGALLHVHTSNYRVRGFSSTPDIRALCTLGQKSGLPVIDDLGSGALVELSQFGIHNEPLIANSIQAGAAVCCFSGDKLICGPQAGIILGQKDVIRRIRKNPFARMFRVDKLTLAGLEATLLHFLNDTYRTALPFYRMLARTPEELQHQAETVLAALKIPATVSAEIQNAVSYIGSGSIPDEGLPSVALALRPTDAKRLEQLARDLRQQIPSVFGRIHDNSLLLDMRTIRPHEVTDLITVLNACLLDQSED